MSGGYSFDQASFRRVGAATRWAEQQMGTLSSDVQNSPNSPQEAWVRTPNYFPTAYDGSLAVQGATYFRTPAGIDKMIANCWVQEINGAPLATNKMYRGFFGGMLEQVPYPGSGSLINMPRFWVESPPQPVVDHYTPRGLQVQSYFMSSYYGYMRHFYSTGWGYVILPAQLSNLTIGAPSDPVYPTIMARDSGFRITLPNGQNAPLCDWYHIPQLCRIPIQVSNSTASSYWTKIHDPIGLTATGLKSALCIYKILTSEEASRTYSTWWSDELTVINIAQGGPTSTIGPIMGA